MATALTFSIVRILYNTPKTPVINANYIVIRTLKSDLKIKWVRPVRRPFYYPIRDMRELEKIQPKRLIEGFEKSAELTTANENVKRIFEIELGSKFSSFKAIHEDLCNLVRRHPYDIRSQEVKIASLTAKIRWFNEEWKKYPKNVKVKSKLNLLIHRRGKQLRHLRRWDYPRFEWLLEKLDIEYRPHPNVYDLVTRKKSLTQLTTIHCEELKEKKIMEFRKKLNEEKVPFLLKKLDKLKWIREQEEKYRIEPTVTEEDIQQCVDQLEKIKIDVEKARESLRARVIHPYTLEIYDPEELRAAESKSKSNVTKLETV